MKPIPKKMHFIWVGVPIPDEYVRNIRLWSELNPDYEVNLWIDSASVCPSMVSLAHQQAEKTNAIVRDLTTNEKTLFENMLNRNHYNDEVTGKDANFAAASDILRLALLEYEGGVYIDTDTLPVPGNPLGTIEAPHGFVKPVGATNDVLAASPNSELIKAFSVQINANYTRLVAINSARESDEKIGLHRGIRPWKSRCDTTLDWTGPGAILPVIQNQFIAPLVAEAQIKEATEFSQSLFSGELGKKFNTQSAKTWLDKGPQNPQEEIAYFQEEFRFRFRYFCADRIESIKNTAPFFIKKLLTSLQNKLVQLPDSLTAHDIILSWKKVRRGGASLKSLDVLLDYAQQCEDLLAGLSHSSAIDVNALKTLFFPNQRYDINGQLNTSLHTKYDSVQALHQEFSEYCSRLGDKDVLGSQCAPSCLVY